MKKEHNSMWALGLMSGTSLDGIDAALIKTDGERVEEFGPWLTVPYDEGFRTQLREAVYARGDMLKMEHELTLKHADAVKRLLKQADVSAKEMHVIGFHGQTVSHRPQEQMTWQIGDGALLAEKTGIDVVCDFRRRDVAAGGQGAPLVPLFHAALARNMALPVAVVNIGGIANVTWVGRSEEMDLLAFDTGPGNVLLNEWVLKYTSADCDRDGKLALAGRVHMPTLNSLLASPYFSQTPPKSLDRNHFSIEALAALSTEDGAATLTEFTAAAIALGAQHFPAPVKKWIVCGGGGHNPALMQALQKHLPLLAKAETVGWISDALEAQAFGFLAMRSLKGLSLSMPTTTGVSKEVTGGAYYRA